MPLPELVREIKDEQPHFLMSFAYNTRLLAAEIMVKDDQFSIIKDRSSYEEFIAADIIPSWLK